MNYAPLARILLRYGVGIALGTEVGQLLAGDADIVAVVALLIGADTELIYAQANTTGHESSENINSPVNSLFGNCQ